MYMEKSRLPTDQESFSTLESVYIGDVECCYLESRASIPLIMLSTKIDSIETTGRGWLAKDRGNGGGGGRVKPEP